MNRKNKIIALPKNAFQNMSVLKNCFLKKCIFKTFVFKKYGFNKKRFSLISIKKKFPFSYKICQNMKRLLQKRVKKKKKKKKF